MPSSHSTISGYVDPWSTTTTSRLRAASCSTHCRAYVTRSRAMMNAFTVHHSSSHYHHYAPVLPPPVTYAERQQPLRHLLSPRVLGYADHPEVRHLRRQ